MRLLLPITFLRSFPLFKPISLTPPSAFFPPSLPFPFLPLPVSFSFPFLAFPSLPFVPRSLGARGTCGGFGSSGIPPPSMFPRSWSPSCTMRPCPLLYRMFLYSVPLRCSHQFRTRNPATAPPTVVGLWRAPPRCGHFPATGTLPQGGPRLCDSLGLSPSHRMPVGCAFGSPPCCGAPRRISHRLPTPLAALKGFWVPPTPLPSPPLPLPLSLSRRCCAPV